MSPPSAEPHELHTFDTTPTRRFDGPGTPPEGYFPNAAAAAAAAASKSGSVVASGLGSTSGSGSGMVGREGVYGPSSPSLNGHKRPSRDLYGRSRFHVHEDELAHLNGDPDGNEDSDDGEDVALASGRRRSGGGAGGMGTGTGHGHRRNSKTRGSGSTLISRLLRRIIWSPGSSPTGSRRSSESSTNSGFILRHIAVARPTVCILLVIPITVATCILLLGMFHTSSNTLAIPGTSSIHDMLLHHPYSPFASFNSDQQAPLVVDIETQCTCGSEAAGGVDGERICNVYGPNALIRSRLVDGTGARVKRFLNRARQGKHLKIGILGGSVSACHGVYITKPHAGGDPSGPGCYPSLFKSWLDHAFPDGEHEIFNGAIGAMDSSYYAFCSQRHIPSDVDLIVLEFDINDQVDSASQVAFDQLIRVLLELPSEPAVVILGAWAPLLGAEYGYGDPQISHVPISHYYDVPYISMKRMMFNAYLRYPKSIKETFFLPDRVHPNLRGHRIMADILIAYLEKELCALSLVGLPENEHAKTDTIRTYEPFSHYVDLSVDDDDLDAETASMRDGQGIHSTAVIDRISHEQKSFLGPVDPYDPPIAPIFRPIALVISDDQPDPTSPDKILSVKQPHPFCADANDPTEPMAPAAHDGWEPYVWNEEKHYWVSSQVGARIRVDVIVQEGRIAVYYFRSKQYDLGDAKCWVDDNEGGAVRLPGYWEKEFNVATVTYIDKEVTPGNHFVTCEIMSETANPNPDAHHWRLVAIMAT